MAKKKKAPIGAAGPQPYFMEKYKTPDAREKLKQYIKEGLNGYVRQDGVAIPGARRIYRGLAAGDGYDLRHIERWPAARLRNAERRIQALNTLTGRPFAVVTPRTKKQRAAIQTFSGQNLPAQKSAIVAVQDPKKDRVKFSNNKVIIERQFPSGLKSIKQRFLFKEYLEKGEAAPITFGQMRSITERMFPDMPSSKAGREMYYTILTVQYGPIGRAVYKDRIMDELAAYHNRYDPSRQHERFAEQVIGFQLVGTLGQALEEARAREHNAARRKQLRKLRFQQKITRCVAMPGKKRCKKVAGHKGAHKF